VIFSHFLLSKLAGHSQTALPVSRVGLACGQPYALTALECVGDGGSRFMAVEGLTCPVLRADGNLRFPIGQPCSRAEVGLVKREGLFLGIEIKGDGQGG